MRYSEKKATQVAAYFIYREGGQIKILKLMKLMYLAERKSLSRYGEPMMGDKLVSMNHGPVLSITLDHMNNFIESENDGWNEWISDREDHRVSLKKEGDPIGCLLELSDADIEILEYISKEYGHMSAFELRDFTHEHCAEWEDPDHSSTPIPYSRVLKYVGRSDEAEDITQRIDEQSRLDNIFSHTG